LVIALGDDVGGLHRIVGLRGLDLRGRDATAVWDFLRHAARGAFGTVAGGSLGAAVGHVEDVELALSSRLEDGFLSWVVSAVVPIHDVVVPVARALVESATSEAESASPTSARL